MDYEQYIASPVWVAKRKARLELDGYRCRSCDGDGSRYQLEVHHRPSAYQRIPDESVENDLITVYAHCQDSITDVIREKRYGRKVILLPDVIESSVSERYEVPPKEFPQPSLILNNVTEREEITHGMEKDRIQVDIISPADHAQRTNSGSDKQVV